MSDNSIRGQPSPVPPDAVLGFRNETALDDYLFANPNRVQGAYVFNAPRDSAIAFVVQTNSSTYQIRGVWERPYLLVALPLQVQAHRAIARRFDPAIRMEFGLKQFAHPAFDVSTFEGMVAPLFLLGCAMFPLVIQMGEVIREKELRLRQSLQAMGMLDPAYWLSWHLFESALAMLFGFFIWVFGAIFRLQLFLKNDFGVVFLTFWFFGQSMVGLGFFLGALFLRAAQSITVGFVTFLIGFVIYFMITFTNFPYGGSSVLPFSYEMNITSHNLTKKIRCRPFLLYTGNILQP